MRWRDSDALTAHMRVRAQKEVKADLELSKNCRKVRVPGVLMRTGELGNTG